MSNEQDIRRIMQAGMDGTESPSRVRSAVSRARRQVGQRDTLAFLLVRIWSALARMLAPMFAFIGEKQARSAYRQSAAMPGRSRRGEDDDG